MIYLLLVLTLLGCEQSDDSDTQLIDASVSEDGSYSDDGNAPQTDLSVCMDPLECHLDGPPTTDANLDRDASILDMEVLDATAVDADDGRADGSSSTCFTYDANPDYRGCGHCEVVDNWVVFACSPPPHTACYRYAVDCIDPGYLRCSGSNYTQYPGLLAACQALCERINSRDAGDRCGLGF